MIEKKYLSLIPFALFPLVAFVTFNIIQNQHLNALNKTSNLESFVKSLHFDTIIHPTTIIFFFLLLIFYLIGVIYIKKREYWFYPDFGEYNWNWTSFITYTTIACALGILFSIFTYGSYIFYFENPEIIEIYDQFEYNPVELKYKLPIWVGLWTQLVIVLLLYFAMQLNFMQMKDEKKPLSLLLISTAFSFGFSILNNADPFQTSQSSWSMMWQIIGAISYLVSFFGLIVVKLKGESNIIFKFSAIGIKLLGNGVSYLPFMFNENLGGLFIVNYLIFFIISLTDLLLSFDYLKKSENIQNMSFNSDSERLVAVYGIAGIVLIGFSLYVSLLPITKFARISTINALFIGIIFLAIIFPLLAFEIIPYLREKQPALSIYTLKEKLIFVILIIDLCFLIAGPFINGLIIWILFIPTMILITSVGRIVARYH